MIKPLVLNLFAGPGAGKSTTAAGVFTALKLAGVNCELVREFAKDKVWERSVKVLDDQLYVLAKQNHRMQILLAEEHEIEVIITDSPLVFSSVYNTTLEPIFDYFVKYIFNRYNNMNYFITRAKPYNLKGRMQDEPEAKAVDVAVMTKLQEMGIGYTLVPGNKEGIDEITNIVLAEVNKMRVMEDQK